MTAHTTERLAEALQQIVDYVAIHEMSSEAHGAFPTAPYAMKDIAREALAAHAAERALPGVGEVARLLEDVRYMRAELAAFDGDKRGLLEALTDAEETFINAALSAPANAKAGDGSALIAAERQRQFAVEGWTPAHDSEHGSGELSDAAVCYAMQDYSRKCTPPLLWPWGESWWKPTPNDRIRELVKAGALIAAEIDRLQRAALAHPVAAQEGGL